ncbi:MAG: BatD family protein [Campylobacterota bacterium]|nr:BatD family protein [Campylobacterota bacterium]
MKNLGKLLILLMIACLPAVAKLSITVDSQKVTLGESVTLKIHASGSDVKAPALSRVCDSKITSSSQGTSIQSINGNFTKSYIFSYQFTPMRDCVIEPISMWIDGKEEQSEAITIDVVAMTITKDSPFILEMKTEKKSVYVGEPFKITVLFKQRRNSEAVDSKFVPPEFTNFWTKEQQQSRRFEEGDYSVSQLQFVVAAQKSGTYSVNPSQIKIATRSHSRDAWGQWMQSLKWRTYFSNPLEIRVDPLPEGVHLVGDLNISATVDKQALNANEAVNLNLQISGSGNFEDIGSLKPAVSGVSVYNEEPQIKAYIENGIYKGSWNEKFAFVSDKSFTIPPFSIRYFDPESKTIKTASTKVIPIDVKGSELTPPAQTLTIKRPEKEVEAAIGDTPSESSPDSFIMGLLAGLLLGISTMFLPWRQWLSRKEKDQSLNLKDKKQLLMFMLQHRDDPEAAELAEKLEALIYEGKSVDIDKKTIKNVIKRFSEAKNSK